MEIPESRIHIEPMNLETVKAVAALEQECFSTPWSLDSLVEELANPLAVFYTAELDGNIVGYVGMHHVIDEGYITNIAVTESCRRKGIAAKLIQRLLEYADKHDLSLLTLEVRPSNAAAIRLYEAFKFERTGDRLDYYRKPAEDALILTRKL